MRKIVLVLVILLSPLAVSAQTGLPAFGSFSPSAFDTINNSNLNVNFSIPIMSSAGRGMPLAISLVNNSLIWKPVTVGSTTTWTPDADSTGNSAWGWQKDIPPGGTLYYTVSSTQLKCFVGSNWTWQTRTTYSNYRYRDVAGTFHGFVLSFNVSDCAQYNDPPPYSAYAIDSTGYFVDATNNDAPTLTSGSGVQEINGQGTVVDTNGNYVTMTVVSPTETDWKDSVGNTALKIFYTGSKTNPSQIQYKFLDGTGASNYQTITLLFSPYTIKTNFGCSGKVEYTSTGTVNLPFELDIPSPASGTIAYHFSYEPTPGFAGDTTGRIKTVTLPTGGTYEYDYGTTNDGINCSDGTTVNVNRLVSNGTGDSATWNFVRNISLQLTTVTTPQLADTSNANDTVYGIANGHEVTRNIYSNSPGTALLRTINTTWATNGTPATQVTILEDASHTQSEADTNFDVNGNLLSVAEYDWGAGGHGGLIRTTSLTYLATSPYTSRNILNLVTKKQITDSGGTIQYRQDIAYDGSALTCPTGALQHDDTDFPCATVYRGDPTSITTYQNAAAGSGGISKAFTYDWFGNLRTAQVNCCQLKTFNYSSNTQYSQPDSIVSGSSSPQLTTSATYNRYTGWMITSTDENSQVTHYGYDFLRRPTSIQRPDGAIFSTIYDDMNFISTSTAPIDGGKSVKQVTALDKLGRAIEFSTDDGTGTLYSIVNTEYDVAGRSYGTSNPYTGSLPSYWTANHFDALGRPTSTNLPDGSVTNFLYSANIATVTDPAGKQRKSQVDGAGRLVSVWEPDVTTGVLNVQTQYTYTVLDGLATAIGAGSSQTRTYTYDNLGRLTSRAEPEIKNGTVQGQYQYAYNSYDLVTTRTDVRGVITTYGYDTLNRLHTVTYSATVPVTPTVTLNYGTTPTSNNNGRLTIMADGSGSENYTYDILGRVILLQKLINTTTYTTNYQYNLGNELTQITYPSGRVVQQAIDPIGRLCAIAQTASSCTTGTNIFASSYNYNNPASQLQGFNYGNGVAATFTYSPDRLQMTSLKYVKGATTLFSLSYSYGALHANNGQITGITDNVDNGRSVTYTYDNLARLATAVTIGSTGYPVWGLSWMYDPYGNRKTQTVTAGTAPSNTVAPDPATNRLTTGYAYDANGNMTNDGSNTLTYDGENRAITSSGTLGSGTYTFDGNNLRVKKVAASTTTVYVFSGSTVIAEYVNGALPASPSREYVYSGSTLLAKIESGATQYYHPDHLSARLMTDATGAKIGEQGHYPFGEAWYPTSTMTKWQFTDYERDAESGNDYARARFYVNRLGRFSALDLVSGSIGDPQSLDRYSYTRNDPINLVDPMGLVASLTCGGGGDDMDGTGDTNSGDSCSGGASDGGIFADGFLSEEVAGACPSGDTHLCNIPSPPPVVDLPPITSTLDNNTGSLAELNEADDSSCSPICMPINGRGPTPQSQAQPWYKNSCVTGALGKGALSVGIDSIGLIPEAGGIARVIGHQAGYVGVVADQTGARIINAVGKSTSTVQGLNGLVDTSPQGLISDGLTVAGFIPGLGQASAIGSIIMDTYKTAKAISQCP